jgi:outer membrane protein TolC
MEAQIKAQLEATRLAARLDDLHAERARALARLNRALARRQSQEIGRVAALPDVAPPAGSWEDGALRYAPEVAARNAAVAVAESQVDVARQEGRPDFYAVLGVMTRREGDPFWTVRLGTELPLWSRPGRLAPAASADLVAMRAESQAVQRDVRAEVSRLVAEWQRAEAQVARTRDAILPQTSTAFDAARTAYVAGTGEFATVIADFRAWLDARIELAEREADRFTTWAELEALVAPPDMRASGGSQ